MYKMVPASLFSWLPKGFRDGHGHNDSAPKNIEEEKRTGRLRCFPFMVSAFLCVLYSLSGRESAMGLEMSILKAGIYFSSTICLFNSSLDSSF
jgi:hypothetical protein